MSFIRRVFMPFQSGTIDAREVDAAYVLARSVNLNPRRFHFTGAWQACLRTIEYLLNRAPINIVHVELTEQSAAIAATEFEMPHPTTTGGSILVNGGLLRITYRMRITQAADVSSDVSIAINWTEDGVSCQAQSDVLAGNTVSSVLSGLFLIKADADTDVTYETSYTSVGATGMEYDMDILVETIQ